MSRRLTEEQKAKALADIRKGVHPNVAFVAAGMGQPFVRGVRFQAKHGNAEAQALLDEIEAAEAQAEVGAVDATHRAMQPIDQETIVCPHCDEEFACDPERLAAMAMRFEGMAKAKGIAAEVAIKTLERRHPKRWSQKVIHTVQEEHERLLDVCQRVLEPEVFELLLEEYLADGSGESETAGGQGEQTGGGVH